jgi:low temperature requirement protein LtrA
MEPSRHLRPRNGDPQPTTAVELLFDLVYAFAITQISHLIIGRLTYTGVAHAALLLWVVWWAWIYTTWMVNWFEPASSPVRLIVVLGALASLLMAAAIPTAFTATPLLFAAAYVVLQVGRNAASRWLLEDDHALRIVFERILVWSLLSAVFWIAGALAPSSWRFALWGVGLLVDFVAPVAGYWTRLGRSGTTDYPVDGGHFAERCQSFVIIVLGESIVVTGAAASARGLSTSSVFALAVAFLITGGLWWLYFGVVAENSKQHLAKAKDPAALARDAYSYLHLPIVAGVIMVAVGDDFLVSDATASLSTAGLIMLVGGPALFLAAENMFRLRMIGSIGSKRAVAIAALCLAGFAASALPALAVGAILAGLLTLLALWEAAGTTNGLRAGSLRRVQAAAAPVSDASAKR